MEWCSDDCYQLSDAVEIDMGVAQGDTLACTLYDCYIDDLMDAYRDTGAGVLLSTAVRPDC